MFFSRLVGELVEQVNEWLISWLFFCWLGDCMIGWLVGLLVVCRWLAPWFSSSFRLLAGRLAG